MALQRVLVGSPVCERASVLRAFLISLKSLEHEGFLIDYIFIDDNDSEISEKLLKNFKREGSEVTVLPAVKGSAAEDTDARKEARLVRVAGYRNRIIRYAMQKEYDAVFLVDSDLILHPALVEYLRATQKGVISELFWSKSCAGRSSGPNAWLMEERAPNSDKRNAALYKKEADGELRNLASPIWHWGKFYEKIVNITCRGGSDVKEMKGKQAINYWWGMSADVIDVICSQNLPHGTNRLITFLKNSIRSGSFQPFVGTIYSQDGTVQCEEEERLSPEEIITMNWLAENVVGKLPEFDELTEEAQSLVRLQGLTIYDNAVMEE